jgi:signal transduction histidine kinase
MCREAELSLDAIPESVRLGRRFVADALANWGVGSGDEVGPRRDDVVLVTSELLANAVRASTGRAGLHIEAHRDHVVIVVSDDDGATPAVVRTAQPGDTSGRGLAIVEALSEQWGTTVAGGGKEVWSKIAVVSPSLWSSCRR